MSWPMCHSTLLQADLREEPVPTTSPTKATWKPSARNLAMVVQAVREAGLAHGQRVQRDVGAAPGVAGRGEVVGVDLAFDLVDLDLDVSGTPALEVNHSAFGPGLHDLLGGGVAFGELQHFVEGVIHQGDAGESVGGLVGQLRILKGGDQRRHVVAAQHGAEDLHRLLLRDQRRLGGAGHDSSQEGGLDFGSRVDAGGNPLLEEVEEECLLPGGRGFQQFAKFGGLLRVERQGGDSLGLALGFVEDRLRSLCFPPVEYNGFFSNFALLTDVVIAEVWILYTVFLPFCQSDNFPDSVKIRLQPYPFITLISRLCLAYGTPRVLIEGVIARLNRFNLRHS